MTAREAALLDLQHKTRDYQQALEFVRSMRAILAAAQVVKHEAELEMHRVWKLAHPEARD